MTEKVLEPAFIVGPDFTLAAEARLGRHFTKKPPFTLTYHIRREARWSDGVPITARDFVFTLARGSHEGRIARLRDIHSSSSSKLCRAVDAKTVRVVLRSRFAGWRALFASVLPRHALAGEELGAVWTDGIDNPKTGRPIGSGPFLVERWERGKQLTLVRNPRYWGPHAAYLDRIVLRFRGRQVHDPVEWFRRDELDVA